MAGSRRGRAAATALLLTLAALAAAPTAVRAQDRPGLSITIGTIGLGELQAQPVLAQLFDAEGNADGEPVALTRTVRARGGWQVGGSVVVGLTPAWSVRAGAGYGRTRLTARTSGPEEDAGGDLLGDVRALDGAADARVASWEAVLRFRLPVQRRLRPHIELGLGGVRLTADEGASGLPDAAQLAGGAHRLALVAALGAEWPLRPWLVGRLAASTRVLATPLSPGEAGAAVAANDTLAVHFAAPAAGPFADAAMESIRALRLEVGLGVRLGPARAEQPAPTP